MPIDMCTTGHGVVFLSTGSLFSFLFQQGKFGGMGAFWSFY
jgi:hypothetical protein